MSIEFMFDRERSILFSTVEGDITYEELSAHLSVDRKACGFSWPEIIDARAATPSLTTGEVRALVWLLHSLGERHSVGPTAFIVRTPFAYGMIRMAGMWCWNMCAIAPFWTLEEAEAWIAKGAPTDGAIP